MTDSNTFAQYAADYVHAGWPCVMPVPTQEKHPPPVGFTGAEGRDTDTLQLVAWAGTHAGHSIALRMPEGVIGIDVDQYVKKGKQKNGALTLAALEAKWGPLPPTWSSTARGTDAGPGESRVMLFRVPARRYATVLKAAGADGTVTGDIEIIQRHHRYIVVWPSVHAEVAGADGTAIYRWYGPNGERDRVPAAADLAELPEAWVAGLSEGATDQAAASADRNSGEQLLSQLLEDWRPECADLTSARITALDELGKSDEGSRHDTMTGRVHHVVQLAASGHTGGAYALAALREAWATVTAGEERSEEFDRMLLTSARKAVTVVGLVQVPRDPCAMTQGFLVPGAAPEDHRPHNPGDPDAPVLEGIDPGRWYSVREAIGTHAFDPNAGLDQTLAEKVLERMYPALRYAYDSTSWLLRVPERWEERKDLSSWAVAQLASLMPVGDPTAEKGSEQHTRHSNRARLMSSAGSKAIASKIDALVKGGTHPASVRLGALDSDPEVIWAGSMPYSLRRSADGPAFAEVDPSTPHLHSAGVTPEKVPTPLWDAFLAAVWPDAELRAWALRVLSISVTGYSDRALPVLLGETGRGKTQVVHLLMSVLGSYAHAANPKLLNTGSNEHDTIVYALKGRRLSFIDEAPSDRKAGQERLKQLTGGGELTARQMNKDPISFRPTHTIVLTANDEPVLIDPAVRSRIRLIPCEGDPEQVRKARAAIGHISGKAWRAEAPGVLAQLMSEAAGWLADPTTAHVTAAPERIRYMAESIGAEQDPVTVWVEEETEPFEQGTPSRELYQAFVASCRRNSMDRNLIPSETKWGKQVGRLGYPSLHTKLGKRRGLRVRQIGWTPMDPTPPPAGFAQSGDGLNREGDGLVTGSNPNPSPVFPQVNPPLSVEGDGLTGSLFPFTRMYAPAHAGESRPEFSPEPVTQSVEPTLDVAFDLQKQGSDAGDGLADSNPSPPKKREQTAAAREKAAATREAKRLAAIAEAAGEQLELPALVTHAGDVRSLSLAEAEALLATLHASALTVDVEHTGYPVGHQLYELRTVQLGCRFFSVVLDPSDAAQADLIRATVAAAPRLHAHSATADLVPLDHAGLGDAEDMWDRMWDTVIPAKLADPSSTGSDPGLKKLAPAVLGEAARTPSADEARAALFKAGKWLTETKVTTPVERSGWAQVDSASSTMTAYAGSDVLDTGALAEVLPWPPAEDMRRERTAQRMTARIAHRGLRIDGEHVASLLPVHRGLMAEAGEALRGFGVENPGSDQQIAAVAAQLGADLPRTHTGRLSVAKGAIEAYGRLEGPLGDFVRARLAYQKAETAIGLFLEPYDHLVRYGDGRARPTVYTLGADTGRMSCVRPNLQQVPREGGFRACLTADPGHLLISADFNGVELRVAAALSQDPVLIAMLEQGVDLHWEAARQVFGPNATKADRYAVKRGVFGWLYGGGAKTLAENMGTTVAVAQALIDTLGRLLPGVTAWAHNTKRGVDNGRTQFPTYAGRIVHMPVKAPHAAANYCIQGTARELLIDALMRWDETPWGNATLLPVHDEIVVMVPEREAEDATAALVQSMQAELFGIPIVVKADEPSFEWKDSA